MKIRRIIVSAAMVIVMTTAAMAQTSLDRAVAVFVASNMKIAVENALHQLMATGVPCDTAAVRALLADELSKPYSSAEHDAATATVDAAMAAAAQRQSAQFLANAAKEPGARVLPDGLVFRTITKGDESIPSPLATDQVAFRYTGTLPDGSVFDSIGPDDAPLTSRVADLTPGMAEALRMMHPGGSYIVTLPADLAYGKQGVPGVIPPDCALRFDVEFIRIIN